MQSEKQAGQPLQRDEIAHLGRPDVQCQDRDEGKHDRGDLIPEHRDRLAAPVTPEGPFSQ
jgi:hypothetical protein